MKKDNNNDLFEFDPCIYPLKLWIMVGGEIEKIESDFLTYEEKPITDLKEETKMYAAFTMLVVKKDTKDIGVIIRFYDKETMDYDTVAHEASHAAKYIFSHINADINPHEPFEFVVGWIANCCDKVKNKIK